MADVAGAKISIAVDTPGAQQTKQALDGVSQAAERVVGSSNNIGGSMARTTKAMTDYNRANAQLREVSRGSRLALQNVSFQIQDIVVQLAAGTSVTQTLTQQLPQLVGGFGAVGAAIGAAIALLGATTGALLSVGDQAQETSDDFDELLESISGVAKEARLASGDFDELRDKIESMSNAARALTVIELQKSLSETQRVIAEFGDVPDRVADGFERILNSGKDLGAVLGLTKDQVSELSGIFSGIGSDSTVQELEAVQARLVNFLSVTPEILQQETAFRGLVQVFLQYVEAVRKAENIEQALEALRQAAAGVVAPPPGEAAKAGDAYADLAEKLSQAEGALRAFLSGGQDAVDQYEDQQKAFKEASEAFEAYKEQQNDGSKTLADFIALAEERIRIENLLADAIERTNAIEAKNESIEALEREAEETERLLDAINLSIEAYEAEKVAIEQDNAVRKERERLQAVGLSLTSEEEQRIRDAIAATNAHKDAIKDRNDAYKEAERAAEEARRSAIKEAEQALDAIDKEAKDVFGDIVDGFANGFEGSLDSLKDKFVDFLITLAYEAAIRPIVLGVAANALGGMAPQVAQSAVGGVAGGIGGKIGGSILRSIAGQGIGSLLPSGASIVQGIAPLTNAIGITQAVTPTLVAGAQSGTAIAGYGATAFGGSLAPGSGIAAGPLAGIAGPAALAALAAFAAYQMGIIGPGPSSGPVGIADFSPGLGRALAFGPNAQNPMEFLTGDNDGDPEGMRPIAEAIADLIYDSADRLGATIDQSLRFRVANYASPEPGNSADRVAGFEVNAFIRGEAERRIAEGLTQDQAIFEAFKFAVTEAFTFTSADLTEAVKNTTAETTEELLADLDFAQNFGDLRDALDSLGGEINQSTLAQAQLTVAIQNQAKEFAQQAVEPIAEGISTALELFPAVGGTITETRTRTVQEERDITEYDEGAIRTLGTELVDVVQEYEEVIGSTALEQERYNANLERLGDVIAISKAEVDTLIDTVTGDFEPAIRGPFQEALEQGQANLEALRDELISVNEEITAANEAFDGLDATLIDVTGTIDAAQTALIENLQNEFSQSIQQQINELTGQGFINTLQDLISGRDVLVGDAASLGLDPNSAVGQLFNEQLFSLFEGLTADQRGTLRASTTDAGVLAALDFFEQFILADREAEAEAERTRQTLIAALRDNEQALIDNSEILQELADSLRAAADALLVNPALSPLSPAERLAEARRQFESAVALANDGDLTDEDSQRAIQQLPSLSQTLLEASLDYYGATEDYLADFNRVQEELRSTADNAENVALQQLDALREIRDAIQDLEQGGSGGLFESAGGGQFRTTGLGGIAAGVDLGFSPDRNLAILLALQAQGITFPGAGEGQINQLRSSNPLADTIISGLGFASGGVFSNQVVSRPTMFPMGAMGEAGPEAIMPLANVGGQLGVRVSSTGNAEMVAELRAIRSEIGKLANVQSSQGEQLIQLQQGSTKSLQRVVSGTQSAGGRGNS